MRLLFVSEFLPKWNSGAEGSILSAGESLEKRGHRVDYIWRDAEPGLLPHQRLYELFELPARQLERVGKALRQAKYDVVILSQPYAYLVYEKLSRAYPSTLFLNRTHGWEDRMAGSWRQLGWRSPSSLARPLIDLSASLIRKACMRTVQACHGVIAPSQLCGNYIGNEYSVPAQKIAVIPYGIETNLLRPRTEEAPQGGQRLLFVGQYLPRKGTRTLESVLPGVAARYPAASLTMVVPETSRKHVESAFRPCFGNRLTIVPWTTREKLAQIYHSHDILLFPSLFEGFGKVFLEAMAAGLCVVGFREGGLPDIAQHANDALLCDPGDRHAFSILVGCALSDPAWVRQIGARARETARRHTWERHAIETERFCRSLRGASVELAQRQLIDAA